MSHTHYNPPPTDGNIQKFAAWFCKEHQLFPAMVWSRFVDSNDNGVFIDYVFWLSDDLWLFLCDDVGHLPEGRLRMIGQKPEADDPIAVECLNRLKQGLVDDFYRAVATITVAIANHLDKPLTEEVLAKVITIPTH